MFSEVLVSFVLIFMPRLSVSLAGLFAPHKLRGSEVKHLLDAFYFFGYELAGAVSLLG
jgi:hypothetical protein